MRVTLSVKAYGIEIDSDGFYTRKWQKRAPISPDMTTIHAISFYLYYTIGYFILLQIFIIITWNPGPGYGKINKKSDE